MSKQYQRPSGGYAGSSALPNRTKYQNDAAQVPKVAISSNKIDGDFNYVIDALNEINLAAGSHNTIAERLQTSLNADGSLKASAQMALDDWLSFQGSITSFSSTGITLQGNYTALLGTPRRVKLLVAGSSLYATTLQASYADNQTTLTLNNITTATGSETTITQLPTLLWYAPITAGPSGNIAVLTTEEMKAVGAAPRFVLQPTGAETASFALSLAENSLIVEENTGSTGTPSWQPRATINSSGFVLPEGSVDTVHLAERCITASKIAAGVLGTAAAYNVGTLANQVVQLDTTGKLPAVDGSQLLNVTPSNASTTVAGIIELATDAEVETGTDTTRVPSVSSMRHHKGVAKAWVNFNGTGSVSIRKAYNVSSISDNGTGDYTVNFSPAIGNTTYAISGLAYSSVGSQGTALGIGSSGLSSSNANVEVTRLSTDTAGAGDAEYCCVTVHAE